MTKIHAIIICCLSLYLPLVQAEDVFTIDTQHTFPSFEISHQNLSTLRGTFNKINGKIIMDRDAFKGTVEIYIDPNSIHVGNDSLTEKAKHFLDIKKYPDIVYVGSMNFSLKTPTSINGQFTFHGVTQPLTLTIHQFNCATNKDTNQYICGADASAQFDRADYGITFGQAEGISTQVTLAIQIEAIRSSSDDEALPLPPPS